MKREDCNESWQKRFEILESIDGNIFNIKKSTKLPYGDKLRISINIWGFIFGPFYYMAKGMWIKGLILTLLAIGWHFVLLWSGLLLTLPDGVRIVVTLVFPLYCMSFATYDYYRKVVHNEETWTIFSFLQDSMPIRLFLSALVIVAFTFYGWFLFRAVRRGNP